MPDDETPGLFDAQPAPAYRCPRCGTGHDEKLEDGDECKAREEFRKYARGTFARMDWG